jgi:hypothetical protein
MTKRAKQWMKVLENLSKSKFKIYGICHAIMNSKVEGKADFKRELFEVFENGNRLWLWENPYYFLDQPDELKRIKDERETAICFLIAINS